MSKRLSLASCCFFVAVLSVASTPLPELFQKAKQQFHQASYSDALKTLDEMARRSAEPGNEKYRTGMAPALAFYRGACLAALGRNDEARAEFETYLGFQPNAQLDPNVYPKSVIAALEDARQDLEKKASTQQTSIADEYKAFRYQPPPIESQTNEHWGDGPLLNVGNLNLLTAEEQREFGKLSDPIARREFLTTFWASRDPNPATPENELRDEFERRVAFADAHFSQDLTRGSLTDRGVVFVLLGPPTYIGRQPIRAGEDPNDLRRYSRNDAVAVQRAAAASRTPSPTAKATIDKMTGPTNIAPNMAMRWRDVWHYRKELLPKGVPYQQVDFEFVTREGYGDNVLQRNAISLNALDAARKAFQSPGAQ